MTTQEELRKQVKEIVFTVVRSEFIYETDKITDDIMNLIATETDAARVNELTNTATRNVEHNDNLWVAEIVHIGEEHILTKQERIAQLTPTTNRDEYRGFYGSSEKPLADIANRDEDE